MKHSVWACLGLLSLVGCDKPANQSDVEQLIRSFENVSALANQESVQQIVDHATRCERAVVFINVNWSLTSQICQRKFAEFAIEYSTHQSVDPAMFHFVEAAPVSTNGYRPLRSVPGWQQLITNNAGTAMIHGEGEVAWIENGRVLDVRSIYGMSVIELAELTAKIMPGT